MSEVKRRRGENFEGFFRRFQRRIQQSGRVLQAKKVRFHGRSPSTAKKRASALHRIDKKKKLEYLAKIGKLPEDTRKPRTWR